MKPKTAKLQMGHLTYPTVRIKNFSFGLLIFSMCMANGLQAQILDSSLFNVWLKPTVQINAEGEHLGNYKLYSNNDPKLIHALNSVADYDGGTFFIAGRFSLSENIVNFGKMSIKASSSKVGQHALEYDSIAGKNAILRLEYTISSHYKGQKVTPHVEEGVYIAEIIFVNRALTADQSRQIESYLALKYSVNITANTEEDLRKYIYGDQQNVWHHLSDFRYDEAVYALGRNDAIDFYQTHTKSVDGSKLSIAFAPDMKRGEQRRMTLANNSAFVIAQLKSVDAVTFCGGAHTQQPYKVRVYGWQEMQHPDFVYITFDSLYTFYTPPILFDGQMAVPLEYLEYESFTQLKIPVATLVEERDYFIVLGTNNKECDQIGSLFVNHCITNTNSQNEIEIYVEDAGLEAIIQLTNLSAKVTYDYEMTETNAKLTNIAPGQYQIFVSNSKGTLIQEVVEMPDCGQTISGAPTFSNYTPSQPQPAIAEKKEILVYPNPVAENHPISFIFLGLDDVLFDVTISNLAGAIIKRDKFTSTQSNNVYTHSFLQKGSYHVRFTSSSFADVKKIVVQ